MTRISGILLIGLVALIGAARPLPAQTQLHGGGQWDFESGFTIVPNPVDRTGNDIFYVGTGWGFWSQLGPAPWGWADFNENKNLANVTSGQFSQEITTTCSDGKGGIWRRAAVPQGHRIRFEVDLRATWSDVNLVIRTGIDPTGATPTDNTRIPNAPTIVWKNHPEVPPPAKGQDRFHRVFIEQVAASGQMTFFVAMDHPVAICEGATFMVDNARVFDLGPADAPSPTPTPLPTPTPTRTPTPTPVASPTPAPRAGDVNGDGVVDHLDLMLFARYWSEAPDNETSHRADFNADLFIDEFDLFDLLGWLTENETAFQAR